MIFLYIAAFLLVLISAFSVYAAFSVFRPKRWDYKKTLEHELENKRFDPEFLAGFDIQDVFIENSGLKLHAQLIDRKLNKTIILMHGHTYTLYGSYKYIKIFLDRGFNVLMPDQRYHGQSEGRNCTLGYRESGDLHRWIEYIKEAIPGTEILGLHGESMGAATVLLGGHHNDVDFVISDCSFSDLEKQLAHVLRHNFKLPKAMIYPVHLFSMLLFRAPLLRIKPVTNIKNIKAPVLFIHGGSDTFVPPEHLEMLTAGIKPKDMVYLCEGAGHAESFITAPETYECKVEEFLKHCGVI